MTLRFKLPLHSHLSAEQRKKLEAAALKQVRTKSLKLDTGYSIIRSGLASQNFAALNRGHHLYSEGRPSRWALAHISSLGLM